MKNRIVIFSLALLPVSALADEPTRAPMEPAQATTVPGTEKPPTSLINYAMSLAGVSYKYGGRTPDGGLDCSGFVSYVFLNAAGLALPHNALAISMEGKKIHRNNLKPGDLVFFKTLRHAFSHVGIYLGDNRFIHSTSSKTGKVEISDMSESYWSKRFNGARRISTLSSAESDE